MRESFKVESLILAGGKSSRMGGERPKPIETVKGRPMIAYGLELLESISFDKRNVTCLVGFKNEILKEYLGEAVKIAEHQRFTGNMGAVLDSLNSYGEETTDILILQGDDCVFLDRIEVKDFLEKYENSGAEIGIMLTPVTFNQRTRITLDDSGQVVNLDKKDIAGLFANGVFVFSKRILKKHLQSVLESGDFADKEIGIMLFIVECFKNGHKILGYRSKQKWMEINDRIQPKRANEI